MKKIVTFFLVIVLFVSVSTSAFGMTDSKVNMDVFDMSVIESSRLYSYDKFEKTWEFTADYEKDNYLLFRLTDATGFRVQLYTEDEYGLVGATFFRGISDGGTNYENYDFKLVTDFYAVVDNTLFAFEDLLCDYNGEPPQSYMVGGAVFRRFINSLADANEIAFRFKIDNGNSLSSNEITIDPVDKNDLADIIEMAKAVENSHFWEIYSDSALEAFESDLINAYIKENW